MSGRKLTQEVERTIKKVNEGVELFDEILEKVYSAPNASQRDKFEGELKKEIKKLQRLREQIRAWISGNEVKDKGELIEKRKVIEARMEKFKICEQKTKMKAYSKEALSQKQIQRRKKSKAIPETEEKRDAKNWIKESQDSIQTQIDEVEAQLEEEQKSRKPDSDTIEALKRRINNHQKYIDKLEMVLLYLEDDQVKPSDIDEIKESVEYYIDENAEPDFVEDELVFDNLIRKAEEAAKYDDFEDIEDEVVIEGNVIQPLPANAEPVAVPIKNEEIEVLKIMDNNAAKLKEKQEKEKQEQLEKEKQEELDKQQRLEQDKIEQEKKAAAKAAASMNAPKKAATTTPTLTTTPTPAAITKTAPANKPAAKQPKQQKAAIKTKPQLITAPKKLQIQPQELNFSSVVAAAAAQSPTKQAQSASIAIKQPAMKPPAQISSKVVSYSEVINPGPTQLVSVGDENKGITPRSATSGASATPITQSVFEQELITFNKNELSDITIQTFSSPTKSILSNKDKKLVPGNIPHVMNAGHVGQNIQNLQSFGQESEKNNEETFGNLSVDGIASLEDMSSRTQETSQAFQMEMPVQSFAQQPISSSNIVLNVTPGVSHVESMSVPMTNMMSMGGSVGTNVGLNFSQSPPPTMPSAATTSLLKPESRDLKSRMLNASLNNLPHPLDCERPRQYIPMNPFDTPAIFPQEQLPILKNPALFNTMDPDTLFFIFYFQQGTYQQYLAAKALKKLAWRYHKKYQTWFQRHEQPKQTTNEYELGTYVYFDYEQDWCQRIKSGFRFEYEYLEDAIL